MSDLGRLPALMRYLSRSGGDATAGRFEVVYSPYLMTAELLGEGLKWALQSP